MERVAERHVLVVCGESHFRVESWGEDGGKLKRKKLKKKQWAEIKGRAFPFFIVGSSLGMPWAPHWRKGRWTGKWAMKMKGDVIFSYGVWTCLSGEIKEMETGFRRWKWSIMELIWVLTSPFLLDLVDKTSPSKPTRSYTLIGRCHQLETIARLNFIIYYSIPYREIESHSLFGLPSVLALLSSTTPTMMRTRCQLPKRMPHVDI